MLELTQSVSTPSNSSSIINSRYLSMFDPYNGVNYIQVSSYESLFELLSSQRLREVCLYGCATAALAVGTVLYVTSHLG